jgi:hypothetical protein
VSGGLHDDAVCPSSAGAESGVLQGTPCRLDGNSCDEKLSCERCRNKDVSVFRRASPNVPAQPSATNSPCQCRIQIKRDVTKVKRELAGCL